MIVPITKTLDGREHMMNDIRSNVRAFVGVPESIIHNKAEELAERYVVDLGIDSEDKFRDVIKEEYKNEFVHELIDAI
jgi:hypothetical protein